MAYDFESLAVSRLTGQFGNSPKVQALMAELVGPLTTLEAVADTLRSDRWIDTAVGAQLDGCGAIVGELRQGRTDDEYRIAIRFRVFVNISKGTPVDLIRGLKFLTEPTESQYLESYPATVLLFTNGFFVEQSIQRAMQDLSPAGVSGVPVAVSFMGTPFRFENEPPPGELFVDGGASYLTADGSDIQVSQSTGASLVEGIGGCVPAELEIGGGSVYLDVGGPTLAVYNPNSLNTLGHNHLTGVFQ
jgi:hypothetical protein